MATHMADLLDAWSVHIAWDYWDTPKIERRLTEVRAIWEQEPPEGRKPLYVSEYDVRGLRNCGGQAQIAPGTVDDCTPLSKTNINAFQHGWFTLRSAQVGFVGASKWDSYYGRYDNTPQAFYMIGSPEEGWPLNPVYFVTRLLTMTMKPGWSVVATDAPSTSKLVTAYVGASGELTVTGLDTAGGSVQAASPTVVSYSIGGVAPSTAFRVVYWNRDGGGQLSAPEVVTSDDAGVVHVDAPLTAMFALTTLPL
jgi:hypothetical protein